MLKHRSTETRPVGARFRYDSGCVQTWFHRDKLGGDQFGGGREAACCETQAGWVPSTRGQLIEDDLGGGLVGNESSKAHARRVREGYFERFLVGAGIDVGCGDDPVTPDCFAWDKPQGDAAELPGIRPAQFDWVYSSHCLEHLPQPRRALRRWWEVLRPDGHLLLVVPDEDLYEQGFWPSRFNSDHLWSFTIHKSRSWSPASINLTELVGSLPAHRALWLRTCADGYDHSPGVWDRTGGPAEAHIEVLLHKLVEEP